MSVDLASPLWVVTSYFNPCKYRKRFDNFQTFRQNLSAPLLVVELEKNGNFELTQSDANVVLQLTGEDSIWQKERLINLGISALPNHVKYVAWVDCDVIFENDNWMSEAIAKMDNGAGAVQLFSSVIHQSKEQCAENVPIASIPKGVKHEIGMSKYIAEGGCLYDYFRPHDSLNSHESEKQIRPAHGLAYAAPIERKTSHQLYDANVIGGADTVVIAAVQSQISEYQNFFSISSSHFRHMQDWAACGKSGKLDFIDGRILHLWHGDLTNRQYLARHNVLLQHDFDPNRDLRLADNGTWCWTNPDSQLARDVASYFHARQEDG
ncbi:MAG: hypothetical protein ACSHXH_16895 [Marivita sp.]|uniref:hypothetical protein n=1 Tax=Marivita sp. TaxID=2003365 RepID=UPI003EF22547